MAIAGGRRNANLMFNVFPLFIGKSSVVFDIEVIGF